MKKIKANRKIIIGLLIGIIISGVTSYAVAATLINSQDVAYDDKTSGLGANNVQSAIDKTCSNIDTRLSGIEDNLYTVSNLNKSQQFINSTTTFSYTGISIPIPAKSYCTVTVRATYSNCPPLRVAITNNSTSNAGYNTLSESFSNPSVNTGSAIGLSTTYSAYTENATTYYVFAAYICANQNPISYYGFCATKIN